MAKNPVWNIDYTVELSQIYGRIQHCIQPLYLLTQSPLMAGKCLWFLANKHGEKSIQNQQTSSGGYVCQKANRKSPNHYFLIPPKYEQSLLNRKPEHASLLCQDNANILDKIKSRARMERRHHLASTVYQGWTARQQGVGIVGLGRGASVWKQPQECL